jgi:hypothetical protein
LLIVSSPEFKKYLEVEVNPIAHAEVLVPAQRG